MVKIILKSARFLVYSYGYNHMIPYICRNNMPEMDGLNIIDNNTGNKYTGSIIARKTREGRQSWRFRNPNA